MVLLHHGSVPASFVMLPILLALLAALVVGLGVPLATLSLLYYDVEHGLPIVLGLLFYASPVFYPASMVPDAVRTFYLANPLAGLLTMFQSVLYGGVFPAWGLLGVTTASTVLILLGGWWFIGKYRDLLPEIG
jgi:ABC-type polysaccharide/polyol phosphate export permease